MSADELHVSSDLDEGLVNAWRRCLSYDDAARNLKRDRTRNRVILIVLAIVTSFLAVWISTIPAPQTGDTSAAAVVDSADANSAGATASDTPTDPNVNLRIILQVILAALPILTAIMILLASEFSPTVAWAVYRVGAEMIRREIYLYRMCAGDYNLEDEEKRRVALRDRIRKASKLEKMYETDQIDSPVLVEAIQQVLVGGSGLAYIQQISDKLDNLKREVRMRSYRPAQEFKDFSPWAIVVWRCRRLWWRFRTRVLEGITTYGEDHGYLPDDGFTPIDFQTYVDTRLLPQFNWYSNRIENDYIYLRRWKVWIALVGGAGSFFVAVSAITGWPFRLEPWVAVTAAVATGMGLYLELRMYNSTYRVYNNAAQNLQDMLEEWEILLKDRLKVAPDSERLALWERCKDFVVRTERVLQTEREEWMALLIQSQTSLEQKLFRSDSQTSKPGEIGSGQGGLAYSLKYLGDEAFGRLDLMRAQTLYQESLYSFRKTSDSLGRMEVLEGFTLVASALSGKAGTNLPGNDPDQQACRAAKLYGAIEALREQLTLPRLPAAEALYRRNLSDAREKLGNPAFEQAAQEVRQAIKDGKIAAEEVIQYALSERDTLP